MSEFRLAPIDASRAADLESILRRGSGDSANCHCTAYHTPDWEKTGPACRRRLLEEGRSDGFLLYEDGRAVAWCQCAPWSSFGQLAARPPAEPGAWVMTCMVVPPGDRGRGLAHRLVSEILAELRRRGAPYLYAMGHRLGPTYSSPLPELPESVCIKAGMTLVKDDPECPRYGLRLP